MLREGVVKYFLREYFLTGLISFCQDFGKMPLCNRRVKSGLFIGKFCFPLCARCTGFVMAILVTKYLILGKLIMPITSWLESIFYLTLIIPCVYDGYRQYYCKKESNNFRRLITGSLAGFAITFIKS